jgi:hypothetical protein
VSGPSGDASAVVAMTSLISERSERGRGGRVVCTVSDCTRRWRLGWGGRSRGGAYRAAGQQAVRRTWTARLACIKAYTAVHPMVCQVHPMVWQVHPMVWQVHPMVWQVYPMVCQVHSVAVRCA